MWPAESDENYLSVDEAIERLSHLVVLLRILPPQLVDHLSHITVHILRPVRGRHVH